MTKGKGKREKGKACSGCVGDCDPRDANVRVPAADAGTRGLVPVDQLPTRQDFPAAPLVVGAILSNGLRC